MPSATDQHEERQYLDLVAHILQHGEKRPDRTGTGTLAVFAPPQLRFDLTNGCLPLLTTKRVFFRGVLEELLWFIKGDTNGKTLSAKGVKIWDGNGSREFLDRVGLSHREEGDLGPIYGWQWRHFGAQYVDCHTDYTGQGVDQLQRVIDTIRNNPTDRRMIVSAWNPADIPAMALPPCHMFCQFYVSNLQGVVDHPDESQRPRLSCVLYQRSCDMGLGVPFNIASYALLTYMVAHVTGLTPGEFIHSMGDTHIYLDHVEALQTQLQREPFPFPTLRINRKVTSIDDFKFEDFEVSGYKTHAKIPMNMSV
ncbi:Thymidylate synthase [Dispira simplex]|nr:Thymidylate synthase [Dispira simplex]